MGMKKVRLSVNLGIAGMVGSGKNLFVQYLDQIAFQSHLDENIHEYLVIHREIPFKIKLIVVEHLDHLIDGNPRFKSFDAIIICLDIYDTQSINQYTTNCTNNFINRYDFQGLTVLAGVDSYYLEKGVPSEYFRISRLNLIKKTNELNFIYCFEIQNKNGDIKEVMDRILSYIILRFQSSNPELLEHAKNYGKEILFEQR